MHCMGQHMLLGTGTSTQAFISCEEGGEGMFTLWLFPGAIDH